MQFLYKTLNLRNKTGKSLTFGTKVSFFVGNPAYAACVISKLLKQADP